ncbi:coiled-coil domain-containing protein 97 [Strigops habroptila]|uniref:coiled-coil domain-containing protein 97 n=1 Tax=Strigops habroptila TaxID=2489341 RepID=UPI0011CEFFE7|nr:coiled-coil domain-containing protein 97 [Strigops habroptila]
MRAREPLLYQHYIGQYRGGRPPPGGPLCPWGGPARPRSPPPAPRSLSGLLLRSMDEAAVLERLRQQRLSHGEEEGGSSPPPSPDAAERELLRAEFVSRMFQRFLDGQDGDFDYSQVDGNAELDDLELAERDAEERYFDAEEPSAAPPLQ